MKSAHNSFNKHHGHQRLHAALPREGVPEIPATDRKGCAHATRCASGARQLRHPQDARGESLAEQAPAFQAPLHANQRVLTEPCRTVLRRYHVKAHPAWQLFQRR